MPSSDASRVLETIRHNAALARAFMDGMTLEVFRADQRTVYAVTRCLEIISEATRRLPENVRLRHPHVPWRQIAGAGNVYRHDYEDVAADIIWNTVHDHLDQVEDVVRTELGQI